MEKQPDEFATMNADELFQLAKKRRQAEHQERGRRALEALANRYGGLTGLYTFLHSRGLDVTRQALHKWHHGVIPASRALELEELTEGSVKREDLRPDLYEGMSRDVR